MCDHALMTVHPTVSQLLKTPVISIDVGASLEQAAVAMRDADVGALAVTREDDVVGIVSERDILRAIADGGDVARTRVGDVMSEDPRYLTVADSASTAIEIMLAAGFRHLPVFDEGEAVGMVSIRDLARAMVG